MLLAMMFFLRFQQVADQTASAPEMISISSLVMFAWRARL
jgi:hypothetical protein